MLEDWIKKVNHTVVVSIIITGISNSIEICIKLMFIENAGTVITDIAKGITVAVVLIPVSFQWAVILQDESWWNLVK